jgi:hypothetical protein
VDEAGAEFLLCAHLLAHRVIALTLDGRYLWGLDCPMRSGFYKEVSEFKPTAAVVGPDGSIYVADGYGASVIHQFDTRRRYVKSFGGEDCGANALRNCHGLSIDARGPEPLLLVCDRRNRRLVHFNLEGRFLGVVAGDLRRPCSITFHEGLLAVAELEGSVVLLDSRNTVIKRLGDNPDKHSWANYELPLAGWKNNFFNAPHGICFDTEGKLYVSEWSRFGRLIRVHAFS